MFKSNLVCAFIVLFFITGIQSLLPSARYTIHIHINTFNSQYWFILRIYYRGFIYGKSRQCVLFFFGMEYNKLLVVLPRVPYSICPHNLIPFIQAFSYMIFIVCRMVTMVIQFSVLILLHCCLVVVTTAEDYKCLPLVLRKACCWVNETYTARNVVIFLSILINFLAAMINIVSKILYAILK